MRFGQGVLLLHMLLALMAGSAVAATSEPIGSTVVVVNRVTAEIARDIRTLQLGDDVRQNEVIEVSTDGLSELKLRDDTKLALGPGSRLLLDKFVYDGERTSGSIAINLIKGAFRFATGLAAKPSYVIRVPNASITVRGTIFDVYIQQNHVIPQNNGVWLLLHEGSVRVCSNRGMCRFLHEPGKLIRITDGGDVGSPKSVDGLAGPAEHRFRQCLSVRGEAAPVPSRTHFHARGNPARPVSAVAEQTAEYRQQSLARQRGWEGQPNRPEQVRRHQADRQEAEARLQRRQPDHHPQGCEAPGPENRRLPRQ